MLYKKLFFQIIFRVSLILANTLLLAYLFFHEKYIATQINLFLLLFIQGGLLVYYLNKTNRDLSHFFSSVLNQDSTIVFNQEENIKTNSTLHKKLNEVNKIIEQARIEKIGQYEYLKQVVEHVGIGILSFNENLHVEFFNPAGKDILKVSKLKSISELDKVYQGLSHKLNSLKPNNQQLINIRNSNINLELSTKLVELKIGSKTIKLLAFQNIQSELDKKEVESWQKIIRVLTHEIMNSVSPIDSATTSISRLYKINNAAIKPSDIDEEIISKTIKGIDIIQQRSKGMLNFVQNFRDLTLLPEPRKEEIKVLDLFHTVEILFIKDIEECSIEFKTNSSPKQLTIFADKSQIEQVLINLVKNSIESLRGIKNPQLAISSFKNDKNKSVIAVTDNGPGISTEIQDNIFTPFFTTKENGSGIGLSLSRQIMQLHDGKITVQSEPNVKTIFTLEF
ncbi:MAG: ATP-binding protein [Bacteroidales bacterium]|jgi:two-component system nitrogen regulation sensor histidine kinase NtrY|nr:ATP-binding protein [Bacteroidales bacterium]